METILFLLSIFFFSFMFFEWTMGCFCVKHKTRPLEKFGLQCSFVHASDVGRNKVHIFEQNCWHCNQNLLQLSGYKNQTGEICKDFTPVSGFQFEFAYNRMSHNLHRVNIIPLWAYSLDCRFGLCIVFFLFFFRWNVNWRQHRKV